MVVDDQRAMRAIVRQLLGRGGITDIVEAPDGEEALALLRHPREDDPDIIICDLHMDRMDGMEFCNAVRRSDNLRDRAIPIIVLTGDSDHLIHEVVEQLGAVKVLTKPVTAEELLDELTAAMGFVA